MFAVKGSVGAELRRFKALAASEPEKSKQIYADGEKLIILASKGEYVQFKRFASSLDGDNIIAYFSAKALMASLIGGHLMLSTFILENGYPLHIDTGLPNILHDCLRELSDYECVTIVKLFLSNGVDVNKQEPTTYHSPLHIAVSRGLVDTIDELIASGADVNIVGADDVMPLTLAHSLDESIFEKPRIIDTLLQRGARLTWRRQMNGSTESNVGGSNFSTSFTSNTQIKAGPSATNNLPHVSSPVPDAPVSSAQSLPTPAPVVEGNRVQFNGAQLKTPTAAAPTHVRFNGASTFLQPVVLPVPPPAAPAVPVNPHAMPLPRVTVTTSSGARLLPPPRVPTADTGAGADVNAALPADIDNITAQVEDLTIHDQEAEEERKQDSSSRASMLVGSVQLSDDGAAMLFSTD
eukprot:CAMPEP_0184998268 /NCGR_PEP_ID=MMETSP1098-20130426/61817_1 /TAXON_ID=89044 /ORGANISM="Spumella elongata, Strain CCAP 955/1" /LENGTH=407 /DNA_ID=CAMNT_0027525037 /DNA_START=14 /DNA_END=1240 /DNA_ORIENTATION=-